MRPVFPLNAHLHAEFFLTRGEDRRGEEEERGGRGKERSGGVKRALLYLLLLFNNIIITLLFCTADASYSLATGQHIPSKTYSGKERTRSYNFRKLTLHYFTHPV